MMRMHSSRATPLALLAALGVACGGSGGTGDGTTPVQPTPGARPVVTAIAPTRVCPGAAFTLVVTGSGFAGQSVLRVNGTAHATTVVSETELRAAIAPTELSAGNATITVANGTTASAAGATLSVAGSSTTTLTATQTGAVAAGQPTFALTIDGSDFTPTTLATWGGAPRPTKFVRATRIIATIDAQDVATAGQFTLGAVDSVSYCRSATSLPFAVLPVGAATSSDLKSVESWATAMIWHPGLKRLLIASRSGTLTRGYLFAVDPETGKATDSLFVDPEPGRMTMTDDGRFLFLQVKALGGNSDVLRVQISPFAVLSRFTVGGYLADVAAVPGSNTSVAVAEGGSIKISIYDNGVARPVAQGGGLSIAFGDAAHIYGYAGLSPATIATNSVSAAGVQFTSAVSDFFTGTSTYLEYHAGRLYLSSGYAFDVDQMDRVLGYIGRTATDWDVKSGDALAVDDRRGRAYEIHNGILTAWDLNTFRPLGTVKAAPAPQYLPPGNFLSHAVRWGTDGLAYNDLGYVYMFRSALIAP